MSLENIGQKLKSAREAQGLSLVQVYERTKIPLNHLEAIDTGDNEELPEPVYVTGFIKRYAECVGLDGQVLGDEYRRSLEDHSGKKNGRNKDSTPVYATPEYASRSKMKVSTPTIKTLPFNLLIILGVVGLISWMFNIYSTRAINSLDPSLESLRNSASRLPAPVPPPAATPVAQPAQPASTTQRVSLFANKHVWVDVKRLSTGESIFQGNLEANDRRDFEDTVGISVRAGEGSSLSFDRGDGKVEVFGPSGKPSDRVFSAPQALTAAQPDRPAATAGTGSTYSAPVVRPRRTARRESSGDDAPRRRRVDDGGYRSIGGDGGARSIDVPYRYTEGRLDVD